MTRNGSTVPSAVSTHAVACRSARQPEPRPVTKPVRACCLRAATRWAVLSSVMPIVA